MHNPQLFCPIRGSLKTKLKAKDGLTFSEEKRRIDCIKVLLAHGYPKDRIEAETIILKLGHKGKNSLRADIVVYDQPVATVQALPVEQKRAHMKIVGEIKRDSADSASAKNDQLLPALDIIPSTDSLGVYWDDVEQTIFYKEVDAPKSEQRRLQLPLFRSLGPS